MTRNRCLACLASAGKGRPFIAREMMYGMRDAFDYIECMECGSIQIADVPASLDEYYPEDYYSLSGAEMPSGLKRWFRTKRVTAALGQPSLISALWDRLRGSFILPGAGVISNLDPYRCAILDVGCGSGRLLQHLYLGGYKNLVGIDPYIEQDIEVAPGVWVYRKDIGELGVEDQFDLVMLHHVFEHLPQPEDSLTEIRELLKPEGKVFIRIPVAGSFAWREYGKNWVQLDPPRHLFIPSRIGMETLAKRSGLRVEEVVYDSGVLQFVGSEGYERNVPLCEQTDSLFTADKLSQWRDKAHQLNVMGDGDQAAFTLQRSS